MIRNATLRRPTIAAVLAALSLVALATSAQADHRFRPGRHHGWARHGNKVVVVERGHSDLAPAFVGLVGGLILGAAISHAEPVVVHECAPPPPRYIYMDAWSDRRWDSLDECTGAAWQFRGPRVIKVVNLRSGECVRTLYWRHDHWIDDDDDWRD